jgi:antirestriction protein
LILANYKKKKMSSQAVMKRQILALAKREPSNEELQKIKQSLAVYKTLTKEEQSKINEMVNDAHAKLESEGKFAKGGKTKTQTLKTALTDLKNKVGVKKFKRATTGTDIKKDIAIPALKGGKRIVRKKGKTTNQYGTFKNQVGTTYYESRANRSDVNQPSQTRKIKLADGGQVDGFNLIYQTWSKMNGGNGISGTIRTTPQMYYVATIDEKGNISFEDLEANTKNIDKAKVQKLWEEKKIKNITPKKYGDIRDIDSKFAKGGEVSQYIDGLSKQEVLSKTIVYDNGGESYDRYTIFTPDGSVYGMSETAEGFNQYIGDSSEVEKGKHLGKKLRSVPKGIQGAVLDRMLDDEQMFAKGGKLSKEDALEKAIEMGVDFNKDFHAQSVGNELAELAKESGYKKSPSSSGSTGRAFFYHLQKIYYAKVLANHKETMRNAPFDENTYPKGTEFADGGKLRNKAKYIPNRNIDEIEVTRNGKTTFIDGANLLDGVYVKKGTKFADGGLMTFSKSVNESTIKELQGEYGGVTIKKMGDLLEQMFPDSFGFELFEVKDIKQQRTLVPTELKGIKDDTLKIYFDKFHSMTFRVFQGGENTYFYFGLTSKDKEYIGTFGFKDEGDVESEYVTSFIAFLCKMYGFPFQVNHSVYAQGGTIKKSLAEFKNKVGASKYREATRGVDIKADLQIPALKKGRRVVTTKGKTSNQYGTFKNKVGSVYYENRPNRYDVNQPSEKRKIKLADGGQVMFVKNFTLKDGIQISEDKTTDGKTFYSAQVNSYPLQKIIPMNENKDYVVNRAKAIYKSMLEFKKTDDYRIYYGKDAKYAQGGTFANGGVLEGAKIYVADLAEYNDGRLVGKWFDFSDYSDASELMVAIQEMLDEQTAKDKSGEVHEEWAVHDFEGFPRSFYSEYMGEKDFEKLYQIAEVANDKGLPIDVLMEAVADFGADEDQIERIAEAYYTSVPASMGNESRDFAYEYIDSIGSITDAVSKPDFYFDYESFGSDARMDYTDEELEEYGYDELDDTELGERLVDEMGGIEQLGDKTIEMYFDYDKFGRDLEYDFTSVKGDDGNFYYFSSNW